MKALIITAVAFGAFAGAAQAGVSNLDYLQAARCRGLAASENLGKLDTTALDAFLRDEGSARELAVRTSASNKMQAALKEANAADGEKKAKLLAQRDGACATYIAGGK
ncbi:hypothetical protein B7G68_08200 [Caulobacter segnis]|uniref:Secreted protein n=2 Tax=Caulobacter segnis TaxID=88688 RepID=D5VIZ3_CAUST|nr:hypothetical protein [Caulobacter segnis]ADG10081.1 conserved hypothetical protein [Caulobacter segnis ATCC 21756]AVQ01831.1 hypothetical protein B7G68_08200 [Caulobacter segnis]